MAAEALTDSMNKYQEERSRSAKAEAPEGGNEKKKSELEERYEQLLKKHSIPDKPEYVHKREQLFMMVTHRNTDAFIAKVIGYPSETIDLLRMAALATDENILKNLVPKEEPDEEQIRGWIQKYMKPADPAEEVRPDNSSVEKSLDVMGRHMVRQQEITSAQITRLTEYIRQFGKMERDKNERQMNEIREEHRKEREAARKQIELLSDENFQLNMKIEEAQKAMKRQAEENVQHAAAAAVPEMEPVTGYRDREESVFAYRRRMKEKKRREDFIASVLGNGDFSKEQLDVIERVVRKNFSLAQLQKICDPKVKAENMELLEAYYERRHMRG